MGTTTVVRTPQPLSGLVGPQESTPDRSYLSTKLRRGDLTGAASILAGFALWEFVARLEVLNPLFLPRLSDVLQVLWSLTVTGEMNRHVLASGQALLWGLSLAVALGVPFGLLMGRVRMVDNILGSWLVALNSVPRISFIPMLIVFFGLGLTSKVAIVFVAAAFPLIINTAAGARTIDPHLLQMATAFKSRRRIVFYRIILPATVPYMLSGFRVAIAQGLIGVVVGEFFAANAGVGYLLFRASSLYNIPTVYAMILVLGAAGVTLAAIAKAAEARFESWRT